MIHEVKMFSATCDICNDVYELWNGCVALNEASAIEEDIQESGEWCITTEGKTYCPDCHAVCWNESEDVQQVFTKDTQYSGAVYLGAVK